MTDPHQTQRRSKGASQSWLFFRQWLKNPLKIAAFSPSGAQLTALMMAEMPGHAERVIELGAGTGVFTHALLDSGIAAEQLLVVELNPALHAYLHEHFPGSHVVCGNATALPALAASVGFTSSDAIVSGLGLLSMPRELQKLIMRSAFDVLNSDGVFIQFTYGPKSPLPRDLLEELGLAVRRGGFAWRNMPPASVFVYWRKRSEGIRAVPFICGTGPF